MTTEHSHLRAMVNQDGAAILDLNSGKITTLNTSGGYIWQALSDGKQIDWIVESLARNTACDIDVVRRDVVGFVEDLKNHDLLPR